MFVRKLKERRNKNRAIFLPFLYTKVLQSCGIIFLLAFLLYYHLFFVGGGVVLLRHKTQNEDTKDKPFGLAVGALHLQLSVGKQESKIVY